jgi:hypothetical protein
MSTYFVPWFAQGCRPCARTRTRIQTLQTWCRGAHTEHWAGEWVPAALFQLWPCTARASSIVNPEATMRLIMYCLP